MNAAIRAVVRTGLEKGWQVFGIYRGYAGLIAGDARQMGARDVGGIIQHGGTILGSERCPEFKTEEGRLKAVRFLYQLEVAGYSFVAQANYEGAVGRQSTRVISCNTTALVRVISAFHKRGLMKRTRTVILRRPRP